MAPPATLKPFNLSIGGIMHDTQEIYCTSCQEKVKARLTSGREIYPWRCDLRELPFWKCDYCENYVGCHHKTKDRTRPLGNIPTKELRNARKHIHAILDPIWQSGKRTRREVYEAISSAMGFSYHTALLRDIDEARKVYSFLIKYRRSL